MSVPAELHYTPEHEWVSVEGTSASVGITEYAAQQLGDVVYISLPALGAAVTAGEPCGEVESVKSVSDLYSPVDGEVTEVNTELEDDPSLVNAEPYTAGLDVPGARGPGRRWRSGPAARPAVRRGIRRADQERRLALGIWLTSLQTSSSAARSSSTTWTTLPRVCPSATLRCALAASCQ